MAETGDRSGLRYAVSATEIAKMFGASTPSTVSNWRARHADFPMPLTTGHNAQFDVDEILSWARRPDTPARLEKPSAMWWWEKTVDAVRAVVDLSPRTGTGNPLRGHLIAVVLLHAALCGEVQGVRASAGRWKALVGSAEPADDLLRTRGGSRRPIRRCRIFSSHRSTGSACPPRRSPRCFVASTRPRRMVPRHANFSMSCSSASALRSTASRPSRPRATSWPTSSPAWPEQLPGRSSTTPASARAACC